MNYDPLADLIPHPKKAWRDDKGTVVGLSGGIQVSPKASGISITVYGEDDNSVYYPTDKKGAELLLAALSGRGTEFVHGGVRIQVVVKKGNIITVNAGDANYIGGVTVVFDDNKLLALIERLKSAIARA